MASFTIRHAGQGAFSPVAYQEQQSCRSASAKCAPASRCCTGLDTQHSSSAYKNVKQTSLRKRQVVQAHGASSSEAVTEKKKKEVPAGRAAPVSTPEVEALLDSLKWDASGMVVAIAQDVDTGTILMQGFSNRDAVSATLASNRATFFSRSRKCLWTKGETSGNFITVTDVYVDCDRDSLIYLGKPDGPTCHTGAETCYFQRAKDSLPGAPPLSEGQPPQAMSTLYTLEATIKARKAEAESEAANGGPPPGKKPSWTRRLMTDGALLRSKIREEADELCRTVEDNEGKERTASEMADVLYHSMVLLARQGVEVEDVMEVLRARFSVSGVEEKAKRKAQ